MILTLLILTLIGPKEMSALAISEQQLENLPYINKFVKGEQVPKRKLTRVGRYYSENEDDVDPIRIPRNQPKDQVKLLLVNHKRSEFLSKVFPAVDFEHLKFKSFRGGRELNNDSPINTEKLLEPRTNDPVTVLENSPSLNLGEPLFPTLAYLPVLVIPYPVYINESHNPDTNSTESDPTFDVKKPLFVVSTSGLHQGTSSGSQHGGSNNNHHSNFYDFERPPLYSGSFFNPLFHYRSNNPQPSTGRPFVLQQTFKPFLQWRPISIQKPPQQD